MAEIMVLGAGGFGIALAMAALNRGHSVRLWSKLPSELDIIREKGEYEAKLPGVKIPKEIKLTADIGEAADCEICIFGVPSSFIRSTAREAAPYIKPGTYVLNAGKGVEDGSFMRMSEILKEEIPQARVAVLSGPSHAEEVARSIPTAVVIASEDIETAEHIRDELAGFELRMYVNTDVIGCELGGALKNVIALCAGICDGMGFGDNTKAALMTRGMHEITRLGLKLGGKRETFSGLTGMGDLIVTCCSKHSRNRRAGMLIGQGKTPEEAVREVGTVEGYFCCRAAYNLAKKAGVDMPITEELYSVLFEGADAKDAFARLLGRPFRNEWDNA